MSDPAALRPEQIQALSYIRAQGTEAPLAKIRGRAAETFAALEALLDGVTAEQARRRPQPGKWSVHEIVDHLIESDRPGLAELSDLLDGISSTRGPIPAGLLSEDPFARPFPQLVATLKSIHRDFLAILDEADDSIPLDARAPVVMVLKVAQEDGTHAPIHWNQDFDWKAYALIVRMHTLEHKHQIERTLA
jgi:hypothetical protein